MDHQQAPSSEDLFLCTTPVYFKAVQGDYLTAVEVREDVPVTEEKAERVLRYKLVSVMLKRVMTGVEGLE
jgi:hypothetical protein